MSSKRLKMRSSKNKVKSEEGSEVFVLPPHLLEKLGINLSTVNNTDIGCQETSNHEKHVELPVNVNPDKNVTTNIQKSLCKDSSIIETADLMTKSVFLSPTFSLPPQSLNQNPGEICTPNIIDFIDYHSTKEVSITESSKNLTCINNEDLRDMNMIIDIGKIGSDPNCDILDNLKFNKQRKSKEDLDELSYEEPIPHSPIDELLISNQEINVTSLVADNHNDEAYLSDYSNSNPEKSEPVKPGINSIHNKINIISQDIFTPNNSTEILSKGNFFSMENNLPITLTDLLSLKDNTKKVPETKLQESTNSSDNYKNIVNISKNNASIHFEKCEVNINIIKEQNNIASSCCNWENKNDNEIEINDNIILDKYASQFLSDDKVLIEIVDKFNDSAEEFKEYDNAEIITEGSENITMDFEKPTLENVINEGQSRVSIDCTLNNECNYLKQSTAKNVINVVENMLTKLPNANSGKEDLVKVSNNDIEQKCSPVSKNSEESVLKLKSSIDENRGKNDVIDEIASYLVDYSKKLSKRRNILSFKDEQQEGGVCKMKSQGVEKPGGLKKPINKVYSNKTRMNLQNKPKRSRKYSDNSPKDADDYKHSLRSIVNPAEPLSLSTSFCICHDFGRLKFYEFGSEYNHIHFDQNISNTEANEILEERDFCAYVEDNLLKTYMVVDDSLSEDTVMNICWHIIGTPEKKIESAAELIYEPQSQSSYLNKKKKDIELFGHLQLQASKSLKNQNIQQRIISPPTFNLSKNVISSPERQSNINTVINNSNEAAYEESSNKTENNKSFTYIEATKENKTFNLGSVFKPLIYDKISVNKVPHDTTESSKTKAIMGKTKSRRQLGNIKNVDVASVNILITNQDDVDSPMKTKVISMPIESNSSISGNLTNTSSSSKHGDETSSFAESSENKPGMYAKYKKKTNVTSIDLQNSSTINQTTFLNNTKSISVEKNEAPHEHPNDIPALSPGIRKSTRRSKNETSIKKTILNIEKSCDSDKDKHSKPDEPIINDVADRRRSLRRKGSSVQSSDLANAAADKHTFDNLDICPDAASSLRCSKKYYVKNMITKTEDNQQFSNPTPNELSIGVPVKTNRHLKPVRTKIKLLAAKSIEHSEDESSLVVADVIKQTADLQPKKKTKNNDEVLEYPRQTIISIANSPVLSNQTCLNNDKRCSDEKKHTVLNDDPNKNIDFKLNNQVPEAQSNLTSENITSVKTRRFSNNINKEVHHSPKALITTTSNETTLELLNNNERRHMEETSNNKPTVSLVGATTTVNYNENNRQDMCKKMKKNTKEAIDKNMKYKINTTDNKVVQVTNTHRSKRSYECLGNHKQKNCNVASSIDVAVTSPDISCIKSKLLRNKRKSVRNSSKNYSESNSVDNIEDKNMPIAIEHIEKVKDNIKTAKKSQKETSLDEKRNSVEVLETPQSSVNSPRSRNRPGRKRKFNCSEESQPKSNMPQGKVPDKSVENIKNENSGSDENDDISLAEVKRTEQVDCIKTEGDVEQSSGVNVVCGVCKQNVNEKIWIRHIAEKHNYLAWRTGEPVVDFADANAKSKHLNEMLKTAQLICGICGKKRKTVAGYLSHQETCRAGPEGGARGGREEAAPAAVTCAVCRHTVDGGDWPAHAMNKHYNLAWIEGEEPINLRNVYAVEKYLKHYLKMYKKFVCRVCGISRGSSIGFYAHYITCGKTEEEIEALREPCDVCHQPFLSIYRQQHMAMHRVQERQLQRQQAAAKAPPAAPALPAAGAAGSGDAGDAAARPRLAAQRANRTIQRLRASELSTDDAAECRSPKRRATADTDTDTDTDADTNTDADGASSGSSSDNDASSFDKEEEEHTRIRLRKTKQKVKRVPFVHRNPEKYIAQAADDFENYHYTDEDLFPSWRAAAPAVLTEAQAAKYFPGLMESCKVRFATNDWMTYRRFETKLRNGIWSLFAGGCIESVAWAPARRAGGGRQYLAVTTHAGADQPRLAAAAVHGHVGLVQIWDFGTMDNDTAPKLVLALAHVNGTAWSIDWCPSGARDLPGESSSESDGTATSSVKRARLGLLAVAFSNGRIFIYDVPYPDSARDTPLVYRAAPVAELRWSEEPTAQATVVRWSKQRGHEQVYAGFSDGSSGMFVVTSQSPLVRARVAGVDVLRPSCEERLHETCVTGLDVFPSHWGGRDAVVTSSNSRGRLQPAAAGCHVARRPLARARFLPHWPAAVFCTFDPIAEELELYGGGRRAGGLTASAECARCGLSARAAPPALRLATLHPVNHETLLQPFATIEMRPLGRKRAAGEEQAAAARHQPLAYRDAVAHYGVVYTPRKPKTGEVGIPKLESAVRPDRFPLAEVTSLQFAPGAHHRRLAVALHCGLLLLLEV